MRSSAKDFQTSLIIFALLGQTLVFCEYKPTWESVDNRALPEWFGKSKVGIMVHWGVFSVPSYGTENVYQEMLSYSDWGKVRKLRGLYPKDFTYQDFAAQFTGELFDANRIMKFVERSGAKYVIVTGKYRDGFTMWPSSRSVSWNAKDVGPKKDILKDMEKAARHENLRFGVYYSLAEDFNPLYRSDKLAKFKTQEYTNFKVYPELQEIAKEYKPDIIYTDVDQSASSNYWRSPEFLSWLYNYSPVKKEVIVNDRWGQGTANRHGGYYSGSNLCNPKKALNHKFECVLPMYRNGEWSYMREANEGDIYTAEELIKILVRVVSCGGNFLYSVGPTKEGTITPIFQRLLSDLGSWLRRNADAIYASWPWRVQEDKEGKIWYTAKNKAVFAIFLNWPKSNKLKLGSVETLFKTPSTKVFLLGSSRMLEWMQEGKTILITLPPKDSFSASGPWTVKIYDFND